MSYLGTILLYVEVSAWSMIAGISYRDADELVSSRLSSGHGATNISGF